MNRAGAWILGLLVVASMAGGGWVALRRHLHREPAKIVITSTATARGPTVGALQRGAEAALAEWGGRAGRFKIRLVLQGDLEGAGAAMGTSEALLLLGDHQPPIFFVTALDNHPVEIAGSLRITPSPARQGQVAAAWAKRKGSKRVFLLFDAGTNRSEAIADAFGTEARRLGLTVDGPAEAAGLPLRAVLESGCDLVFYSGEQAPYGTGFKVFSAIRKTGFSGPLVMADADPEVSFLATRPDLVDGTYLVSPFAPAPPEVAARTGATPGPHVTAGYYAMRAALEAIDLANSLEPDDLRRAAARLPYFDAQGRAALRTCALYVARAGKFEFVEPLE
jgi:hypothetical protein